MIRSVVVHPPDPARYTEEYLAGWHARDRLSRVKPLAAVMAERIREHGTEGVPSSVERLATAIALIEAFVEQGDAQYVPDEDAALLMDDAESFLRDLPR